MLLFGVDCDIKEQCLFSCIKHSIVQVVAQKCSSLDLEIDRSSRSISAEVDSIDRVDSSRVDRSIRSSKREVESVDNIDSKSTFGSGADSAEHGEQ